MNFKFLDPGILFDSILLMGLQSAVYLFIGQGLFWRRVLGTLAQKHYPIVLSSPGKMTIAFHFSLLKHTLLYIISHEMLSGTFSRKMVI